MILDRFALKDRVAIVTGASQGIGEGVAVAMAEAGAKVALVSRTRKNLESVAERIKEYRPLVIEADIATRSDHEKIVSAVMDAWGRIDILVNNAGINVRERPENYREEDWDQVVGVNLKGTFFLTQAVARQMIEQQYGKIVFISSLSGLTGIPNIPAYTAAKGGVSALTRQLALDWAPYQINVNAICPGYIRTPLTRAIEASARNEYILNRVPMRRWGEPEDIAGTAVFLSSAAADFLTGQLIVVDGGWMAGG